MTKGKIGLNAGAIWNLLADGESFTFETLKKRLALCDADLWSAIGWLARENKIELSDDTKHNLVISPGTNYYY